MSYQTNMDSKTVNGFGQEWSAYDQTQLSRQELEDIFADYFKLFPFEVLNKESVGVDFGCGSGRWAKLMAPRVGKLYCLEPSDDALLVAKSNLKEQKNIEFLHSTIDDCALPNNSIDFAYSLGVLHHIPDVFQAICSCVSKLKSGAPFLVYLYYAFDNKPTWFRALWKTSDYFRRVISRLPFKLKLVVTISLASLVYYPLAKFALLLDKLRFNVDNFPLAAYREKSFYVMRTDALDRFGTRLEHRFTKEEIHHMLEKSGLVNITIGTEMPYWCAIGFKK